MSLTSHVVVVGSINEDQVLRVAALPRPGETVIASGASTSSGGKGANQAVAAARAGATTRLVGAIGTDARAARLEAQLQLHGVDTTKVDRVPGASGGAVVVVDHDGDNCIVVQSGANALLGAESVSEALAVLRAGDVVLIQCEIPVEAISAAVDAADAVGATTILNWSPVVDLPTGVVGRTTVLVVNRGEAQALLGNRPDETLDGAQLAASVSRAYGPDVVVTLGAQGAVCSVRGRLTRIDAVQAATVVDSTGAGDTFAGTLAAAVSRGISMEEAVEQACAAAAAVVSSLGAQPPPATAAETAAAHVPSIHSPVAP